MKILISRTDSIGDVILTLPLCGWIKKNIPNAEVHFLCQKLTVDVLSQSVFVDQIHIWEGLLPDVDAIIHVFPKKEIAKEAKKEKINLRIGTSHRLFHLTTCNQLTHFSRLNSNLHESQLNFMLLKGLGYSAIPKMSDMSVLSGWRKQGHSPSNFISNDKFNLIFHIKSRGSAKEWKSSNYLNLAQKISKDQFNLILTGTESEGDLIKKEIPKIFELENITNTTGKLSLVELIELIDGSDGLLACSTGPLHVAGISGINCLGLYPKQKPMHAERWGPIGLKSSFIEEKTRSAEKYLDIPVKNVLREIITWLK